MAVDAVTAQVIGATLSGVVQEMQNSLFRTGFSTIIRESQDASCAVLTPEGRLAAQHVVLPLHIGAFPACLAGILERYPLEAMGEGDAFLINHPYMGGSPHAPDIAVVTPAFHRGGAVGFLASIAHKSDLGGPVPGSCSGQARETFNEGLHIPPVRFVRRGEPCGEIEAMIAANSRTPELVLGDIRGQLGCARLGERRLDEVAGRFGPEVLAEACALLADATRRRLLATIAGWPDGTAEAERSLDDDGVVAGQPVRIHVRVSKSGEHLTFDFSGSDPQTRGPANIRPPIVRAGCAYVLIALTDPAQAVNGGLLEAFEVRTRPGSVVDPQFPAPVNTYNPTVHCLVDACFEAMSRLLPDRRRADGCGSRSVFFGGSARAETRAGAGAAAGGAGRAAAAGTTGGQAVSAAAGEQGTGAGTGAGAAAPQAGGAAAAGGAGRAYVQYEIFGGGGGARTGLDGTSGVQVNQSNGRVAPIEVIESEFPVRVRRFELIPDSAGAGEFRGGLAFRRVYESLAPESRFSIRSTKHVIPALGLDGGRPGRPGACIAHAGTDRQRALPARFADLPLASGDVVVVDTPGGGGLGDPLRRPAERVLEDVRQGYVTAAAAREGYGVVVVERGGDWEIDPEGTAALRGGGGARAGAETGVETGAQAGAEAAGRTGPGLATGPDGGSGSGTARGERGSGGRRPSP